MAGFSCPRGHASSEPDFCSECGARIGGSAGSAAAAGGGSASAPLTCPDCNAPRAQNGGDIAGDFCEVCGYNFSTGAHGDVAFAQAAAAGTPPPVAAPSPPTAPAPAAEAPEISPKPPAQVKWSIVASIDPALREDGSPEPPANTGPFTFAIEKTENLIGRHSRARGIDPEIALDFDDAVSHRHAILTRLDDGSLTIRDIGSANGTRLNGADLQPLTDNPLNDGDQVTLGHWTRLAVKAGA